jgi:putative two-component system response regulator
METTGKRVLLVEDDRFLRRACEASLRQRGLAVTTAADGEEGLRLARSEQPDLILLDMLMPKLSGLEVLRALRGDDATRGVKVLILSNSSREQDIAEVSNLGISGYFVKSNLSLQELGELVGRLLAGQDDRFLRRAAEASLRRHGLEVLTAADGEEALRIARAEPLDLILLDVMMPKLDGFEVLSALKQDDATAHIPVLVLSNLGQERDVTQAKALGAVAFLVKANLSLQDLVDRVDAALATGKP